MSLKKQLKIKLSILCQGNAILLNNKGIKDFQLLAIQTSSDAKKNKKKRSL